MISILIIGNGFDLAHNLPTSYTDYLHMNESILKNYEKITMWLGDTPSITPSIGIDDPVGYNALRDFCTALGPEKTQKFYKISKECFWIQHFLSVRDKIGDKWLDFEAEIEDCVSRLIDFFNQGHNSTGIVTSVCFESLNKYLIAKNKLGTISVNGLFELLHNDYGDLIDSMELYMGYYINSMETHTINDIFRKKYDKVISFNYTNTFERIYSGDRKCCYIHGKAVQDRIVLGYQKPDESRNKDKKEGIIYQKYYQKIVNKTDNSYLDWLSDRNDFTELTIFGHSLSPTDGDILEAFITRLLTKTLIYCKDEDDRAEKIRNLAIILGADALQLRAGGREPSIKFEVLENTKLPKAPQIIR